MSPRESQLGLPEHGVPRVGSAIERWLDERLNLIVLGVIAAGFLIRLHIAGGSFLNPDEALHYLILNQRSAFFAYKVSLTNAHPPLIYLLLYFWSSLGRSELMLRFPSVLAGTALCWFAYKWIGNVFGRTAGVIGIILVAFSPAMIALSAEVRSYALLLFCETAALYFVEKALREKSVREMWSFSIFLYLAILSHYSALFLVLATGIYALARIVKSPFPRKVAAAWAGGQAGALAIYGFLYVTHVSKLRSTVTIWADSFDHAYPHADRANLFTFARERTLDIFAFLFENKFIAQTLLALWVVAVSFLILRGFVRRREQPSGGLQAEPAPARTRYSGLLLLLPFIAVFGAAALGVYPYTGSRHTVFLAPFLIAALSFPLASVCGQKLWAALLVAVLLMGASNASGKMSEFFISRENQSRTLMDAAVNHIQQTIPAGGLILTDYQSALLLVYYLCGPKVILPIGTFNLPASRVKCDGYTIASFQTWSMDAEFFLSHFEKIAEAQRTEPGDRVWVFESGWEPTLARQLPLILPGFRCVRPKTFGANISVIPLAIGAGLSPVAMVTNCPEASSH